MQTNTKLYFTISEAADVLGVSRRTIRRRRRDGSLLSIQLGRVVRIPAGAILPRATHHDEHRPADAEENGSAGSEAQLDADDHDLA